jgi:hypothetical protein
MDYKMLIILLALAFLVLMVYREISNLRSGLITCINKLMIETQNNNDKIASKLQSNMINCVGQIKNISSDNLHQLKKITLLNHQPIRKISNHFTETDDSEIHTDIHYLSDTKNIFQKSKEKHSSDNYEKHNRKRTNANKKKNTSNDKSKDSHYYMSEDSVSSHYKTSKTTRSEQEDKEQTSEKPNIVCEDGVCYLNEEQINEPTPDKEDTISESTSTSTLIPIYQSNTNKISSDSIPVYGATNNPTSDNDNSDTVSNISLINNNMDSKNISSNATMDAHNSALKNKSSEFIEDENLSENSKKKINNNMLHFNFKNSVKDNDQIEIDIFNMLSSPVIYGIVTNDDIVNANANANANNDDGDGDGDDTSHETNNIDLDNILNLNKNGVSIMNYDDLKYTSEKNISKDVSSGVEELDDESEESDESLRSDDDNSESAKVEDEVNLTADKSEEVEVNSSADDSGDEEDEVNLTADNSEDEEVEVEVNLTADKSEDEEVEVNSTVDNSEDEEVEDNSSADDSEKVVDEEGVSRETGEGSDEDNEDDEVNLTSDKSKSDVSDIDNKSVSSNNIAVLKTINKNKNAISISTNFKNEEIVLEDDMSNIDSYISAISNKSRKKMKENKNFSNQLKSVEKYNMTELKEIAKSLSLNLTYLDGNQRRSFKKDELYKNIKTYLNKNKNLNK